MARLTSSFSLPVLTVIAVLVLIIVVLWLDRPGEDDRVRQCDCPVVKAVEPATCSNNGGGKTVAAAGGSEVALAAGKEGGGGEESGRHHAEYDDGCKDGYHLSYLLSRYIDIDFIDFVLGNQPKPQYHTVVDIGIYEAGGLIHMARMGYNIEAYEANPNRYNACMTEINKQSPEVQNRIKLKNLAVSDNPDPMCFQLAGLDGHMYQSDKKDGKCHKEKSLIVNTIPMEKVVTRDMYFVKIDTQGFDSRILEQLIGSIQSGSLSITFIQFEFTPHFEVTRAGRTKEDHKRVLRKLQDAGYDLFQGGAVQPWKKSHRSKYGKTPLAMLAVERSMPTCVDAFVDRMHDRERAVVPGQTSTDFGMWMDILAVKRLSKSPYYRHTGWVLSRHM